MGAGTQVFAICEQGVMYSAQKYLKFADNFGWDSSSNLICSSEMIVQASGCDLGPAGTHPSSRAVNIPLPVAEKRVDTNQVFEFFRAKKEEKIYMPPLFRCMTSNTGLAT